MKRGASYLNHFSWIVCGVIGDVQMKVDLKKERKLNFKKKNFKALQKTVKQQPQKILICIAHGYIKSGNPAIEYILPSVVVFSWIMEMSFSVKLNI